MTQRSESSLSTADGLSLRRITWLPEAEPRGLVILSHGMGEHVARYEHVAQALVELGFAVTGHDHRGFGRSEGLRGHASSFTVYGDDLAKLVQTAQAEHPGLPTMLWAHSMGGLIALQYNLDHPDHGLAGFVLSNPLLAVAFEPPRLKVLAARALSRLLPRLRLPSELDANAISRDPEEVRKYVADPLVHDLISTRMFIAMNEAMAAVKAAPKAITVPTLWVLSGKDALVSSSTSEAFAKLLPRERTTIRMWPEGFHEPHNDLHQAEVIALASSWLAERV